MQARTGDGTPITVGGWRLRALLARLALEAGTVVTTDTLIGAIWGEQPPSGVANALQSLVSRLRRALREAGIDPGVIESHAAGYLLDSGACTVDVRRFEELAAAGRRAFDGKEPARSFDLLGRALSLWRGQALADVADAPFAQPVVARLDELRIAAAEDRIDAALGLGKHGEVRTELDSLVEAYPLRERISGMLIRALCSEGRQADALAAYETIRRRLADDLGIDPSGDLQQLHLAALRGELAGTLPSVGQAPRNVREESWGERKPALPSRLTSFVGREADVHTLDRLLAGSRLVTLHGPGGAGKTRIAIEYSTRLAPRNAAVAGDGVAFAELAPVGKAHEVAPAVLQALGLRETVSGRGDLGGDRMPEAREATDRLVEALEDKRALLVLDNCEHVISASASLAETLLAACPSVRIVCTSREQLGVAGEQLRPVGPLPLPDSEAVPRAEGAGDYAAIRLFAERASAVRPDFTIDDDSVRPVADICRRLDGMPLAIELAAARTRSLSPRQIADRLDDRFRLLTNGGRTALPRHHTLRAAVAWSWDLLDEPERAVLRRLAVFAGGASIEAIEQVCTGTGVWATDIVALCTSLVDKSLVDAFSVESLAGEVRYRLLETVKAYAAERLTEAGEAETAASAHADHYRDLVERAGPYLRQSEQLEWLARITADSSNIRAALRFSLDRAKSPADADRAVGIAAVLGYYWVLRGNLRESLPWLTETLAVAHRRSPELALVHLYCAISRFGDGEIHQGIRLLAWARRVCRGLEGPPEFPVGLILDAIWFGSVGAAGYARLDPVRAHGQPWVSGIGYLIGALVANTGGDPDTGDHDLARAQDRFREVGDRFGLMTTLRAQTWSLTVHGEHRAAVDALNEAERMSREIGTVDDIPSLIAERGMVEVELGEYETARISLNAAMAQAQEYGVPDGISTAQHGLAWLAHRQGDVAEARRNLDQARAAVSLADPGCATLLSDQAHIEIAAGELDTAAGLLGESLRVLRSLRDVSILSHLVQTVACLAVARHRFEHAATLLGVSTRLRGVTDRSSMERANAERSAREELGTEAYERAYECGATLTREAAVHTARLAVQQASAT